MVTVFFFVLESVNNIYEKEEKNNILHIPKSSAIAFLGNSGTVNRTNKIDFHAKIVIMFLN